MHLHPLGVEVVAGLDAPPDDGEARVPRRRLHPERGVRMQELRLVPPGVDELLEEAGRRVRVPFRALRARTKPARNRFGPEAGKRRHAAGRKHARRRVGRREGRRTRAGLRGRRLRRDRSVRRRPRAERERSARQHARERESAWSGSRARKEVRVFIRSIQSPDPLPID